MSNIKIKDVIDRAKLLEESMHLVQCLAESDNSSGAMRAANSSICRVLELVLSEQEIELLKFNEKNPNLLRDPWGIRSVSRVPDTDAPKTEIIGGK